MPSELAQSLDAFGPWDWACIGLSLTMAIAGLYALKCWHNLPGTDAEPTANATEATAAFFAAIGAFLLIFPVVTQLVSSRFAGLFGLSQTHLFIGACAGQLSAAAAILAIGKFLPRSLHWAPSLMPAEEQLTGLSEFRQAVRAWSFPRWALSFLAIFALGVLGTILWKLFCLSWQQLYLAGWVGSPPADELQDIVQVVMRTELGSIKFIIITLAVAIGAPIMEELVFRGMLYPSLKRLCQPLSPGRSRLLAAILTGMVFSAAHLCASAAIPLFAFGAFMCLIRDRYGLLTCISIHASFNLWNLVWLKLAPNASNL